MSELGIGVRYYVKDGEKVSVKGKKGNLNQNSKHIMRVHLGMRKSQETK
jgi:hypothetical protein